MEPPFQLLIGHRQRAHPVGLHGSHIDLILPALGEQAHPAVQDDLHAAFRAETHLHGIRTEHDTGDHRPLVLQREVLVAGRMCFVIGKLATDADLR